MGVVTCNLCGSIIEQRIPIGRSQKLAKRAASSAIVAAFITLSAIAANGSEPKQAPIPPKQAASASQQVASPPKQAASPQLVSFAPSNTELLYSIGAGDKLVGVCSYCDYPEFVKKKTIVGNFIAANLERLASVKPDKVVCVSGQEGLAGQLTHNGYKVLILKNDHLSDISKNLKDLAALSNSTARGPGGREVHELHC